MGSSAMSAADPKQIAQQSFLRTKDLSLTSAEADGLSSFSPKLCECGLLCLRALFSKIAELCHCPSLCFSQPTRTHRASYNL